MKELVLYVHGKGGSAAESAHYKPLFPGCEVLGLDYQSVTPWEAGKEIREAVQGLRTEYEGITLIANSIGAYFCMRAGLDGLIERAYFISPVVDMEGLILNMMTRARVTEAQLKAAGEMETEFGEELSWGYLCDVRSHPVSWELPTEILFGSRDELTSYETVSAFAKAHGAKLTVMEGGEHWFHTEKQMAFLDRWILSSLAPVPVNGKPYWQSRAVRRPYRDEDYEAVCKFLIELNRADRSHINWNWARFEWMMEHPEFDRDARSAIGLWWAGDRVVGAAIYDMYYGEAFCGALPEYQALYPEILDYAWRVLKDDSGLAIAINQKNEAEKKAALQAGFERIDQKETIMERSLDQDFPSSLPEGFALREMDQIADREALSWLFWQGFDHGEDREAFERSFDPVSHARKHFNKSLCLSAVDASGAPVSHCSLWFHPNTDYAYVEPVCTIPSCRGKRIASALLSEAFSRAKTLGAKKAYVISDLPFYEKLGFEITQHYSFWRKA